MELVTAMIKRMREIVVPNPNSSALLQKDVLIELHYVMVKPTVKTQATNCPQTVKSLQCHSTDL